MAEAAVEWRERCLRLSAELKAKSREVAHLRFDLQQQADLIEEAKAVARDSAVVDKLAALEGGFPYELRVEVLANVAPGFLSSRARFAVTAKLVDKRDRTRIVDPKELTQSNLLFKLDLMYADVKPYTLVDTGNAFYVKGKGRGDPVFAHHANSAEVPLNSEGVAAWKKLRLQVTSHAHAHAPARPLRVRVLCANPEFSALGAYSRPLRCVAKPPPLRNMANPLDMLRALKSPEPTGAPKSPKSVTSASASSAGSPAPLLQPGTAPAPRPGFETGPNLEPGSAATSPSTVPTVHTAPTSAGSSSGLSSSSSSGSRSGPDDAEAAAPAPARKRAKKK